MVLKICEVCGKMEEHTEEKFDVYGICEDCIIDGDLENFV
jgi:hypothetical protein